MKQCYVKWLLITADFLHHIHYCTNIVFNTKLNQR